MLRMFDGLDEGEQILLRGLVGIVIGALCGALPLIVGLLRGHRSMAWTGFGVCVGLGAACLIVALVPAILFTVVVAVSEPIEKGRKKTSGPRKRKRRRERADDFLDDDEEYERRRRRRRGDD